MNQDVHTRAARLIAQERVEGIMPADREWLNRHLEGCGKCSSLAGATDRAFQSLRLFSVSPPPTLASRTQFRVRLRAEALRTREPRLWALGISCALSWVVGVASAPFVWRAFAWLGGEMSLPALVWQAGFVLWWLVPAGAALALVAWQKARWRDEQPGGLRSPPSNRWE